MPKHIPEHLFTLCRVDYDVERYAHRASYYYRPLSGIHEQNAAGVLFSPVDEQGAIRILQACRTAPWLHKSQLWGVVLPNGFCVSDKAPLGVTFSAALANSVLYLCTPNALYKTSVTAVYDTCRELMKFINCRKCVKQCSLLPSQRAAWQLVPEVRTQIPLPLTDTLDLISTTLHPTSCECLGDYGWKAWKTQVAGHTYVPPRLTQTDEPGMSPDAPQWALAYTHNFRQVEEVHREFSERSKRAAATRKILRTECTQCCFAWHCDKYYASHCEHGAWKEEEVTEALLKVHAPFIAQSHQSIEELWRIAHICGVFFKKNRCSWTVSGLTTYGTKEVVVRLERTAKRARYDTKHLPISELRDWLPLEMQALYDEPPPVDKRLFAMWLQYHGVLWDKSYSFMYSSPSSVGFGSCDPRIGYVAVEPKYGHISLGSWGKTFTRTIALTTYAEIMSRANLSGLNIWKPFKP